MESLNQGNSYFVDESFDEALECYNKACKELPNNFEAFSKRSQCYQKLGNLKEALVDINQAIKIEESNSKAYLKKGQICFELEEFDTALKAFEKGSSFDPENNTFKTWIRKSKAEIESSKPNTTTTTTATVPTPVQPVKKEEEKPKLPIPSSGGKVRNEFYQTSTHVIITIYAKFVTAENSKISVKENSLSISFMMQSGSEFVYDVEFFDPIVESESSVQYFGTKVEIKMKKSRGIRWETLEKPEKPVSVVMNEDENVTNVPATKGVVSPYTSKKNWDAISVDEDKVEGDAALNKVFRDIYSRGSDEQQRAMMKSFVESGGTVLSTNWDDVKKKKVEGSAPKGMEMNEWEKTI